MSICQGFYIRTIFKVLWYKNPDTYEKLIFVGHCNKEITRLLKKLEGGYDKLTDIELVELNKIYPNVKKVFGIINPNNTRFIFSLIDDNDSISHIVEDIHIKLNIPVSHIYLWYKPNIISSQYFNELVKCLFDEGSELSQEQFTKKLEVLSGGLSIEDLKAVLVREVPNKYKNVGQVKLFDRDSYIFNSIIYNEDLRVLLEQFPISLTVKYLYISGENKLLFTNYNNPLITASKKYSNKDLDENYIQASDQQFYKLLNSYGRIDNNEIFMITKDDMIHQLPSKLITHYFPLDDSKYKPASVATIALRNSTIIDYPANLKKYIEASIDVEHCSIKDIIISTNPNGYSAEDINLTNIFNHLRTYNSMPIIKIYEKGVCVNAKLYNSFIKTETDETIAKILAFSNVERQDSSYIVFVCYLEKHSYMNCYLYSSGQFKTSLQFLNYTDIVRVRAFMNIANILIHKIIAITKSNAFKLLEMSSLFEGSSISAPSSILDSAKISMEYKLKHPVQQLFSKIVGKLRMLSRYISFRDVKVLEPNINLIYKSTDDFYNPENIKAYIAIYKNQKGGGTLSPAETSKLEDIIERYFFIDKKAAQQLIESVDITAETYGQFKFSIYVDMTIGGNNSVLFHFEHVADFSHVRKFLQYMNIVFHDILENTNSLLTTASYHPAEIKNIALDTVGYDPDDGSIDLDISELEELEALGKKSEPVGEGGIAHSADELALDYQKQNKGRKLKFSTYMSKMREKADPELYSEIENYDRSCPAQSMRQPYIVSKKELETFDKRALTGAMKYRNNYYICPRIWDVKARKPISTEEFIKHGMKSPYTSGMAIPPNKRTEFDLDDKYTVIVRKPRSADYWSDPNKDSHLPEILKGTGAEAYPGLIHLGEHPKKFCAPCCYKHRPDDYNKEVSEVQIFKKFYGWDKCETGGEATIKKKQRRNSDNPKCLNENYILDKTADLEHCRLGLLPDNLDLLLNNNQNMFLNQSHNALRDNANCFLKRGVFFNGKNSNFMRCIDNIKEINDINAFKRILVRIITPELFITLNNGDLVKLYCSNDLLPNMNMPSKMEAFRHFIKKSSILSLLFGITEADIDNIHAIVQQASQLNMGTKKSKSTKKTIIRSSPAIKKFKNLYILYQIMTAHANYINNIMNPENTIDYRHLLDLISRPNDLLFSSGVNIIIFDKTTQKIQCNPYTVKTRNFIILINENDLRFTPIYHVIVKYNTIKLFGVIRLSENINLDDSTVAYYTSVLKNSTVVQATRMRVVFLQNLYFIHSRICLDNKKSILYMKVSDYLNLYSTTELHIKAQIITNTTKVQYLLLSNGYLLPIFPTSINIALPVEYLSNILLNHNLLESWEMYKHLDKANLGYQPRKLLVKNDGGGDGGGDGGNICIGIEFENGLMVPIMLQPIPAKFADIPIKEQTFYTEFMMGANEEKLEVQKLLFQDYLYQQFKYEFSMYINEYNNKEAKGLIRDILNKYDDLALLQQRLTTGISQIMAPIIGGKSIKDLDESIEMFPGLTIGTCYNIKNTNMCRKNQLCSVKGKESGNLEESEGSCGIRMNAQMLELFAYLLAQDMINNSNDKRYIIDGKYIPILYISNRILSRSDESIVSGDYLNKEIKTIRMEKFHRNLPIIEYLGKTYNTHILSNAEYDEIKKAMERERIKSINKLSNILANISLEYLLPENLTIATPFDAEGHINVRMTSGPCIFPYLDTTNYKLVYSCGKNEKGLMTCPTMLNLDRKPVKWGYCPEDPEITKRRLKVIPVETVEDSKSDKYKVGKCIFPFLDKNNNLSYKCLKDVNESGNEFEWCPIKFKNNGNSAPVAARDLGSIWKDKWGYKSLFKPNTNKISEDFMKPSALGYCQPPENKDSIEGNEVDDASEPKITLDNYQPLSCLDTPSKGGYSKNQLYNFGKNVLKIPYVLLKKGENKLGKEQLCAIINEKFREVRKTDSDLKSGNYYKKNIYKCLDGEKKGGYKLQELRELGVQHFGLSVDRANAMNKPELCAFIAPLVKKSNAVEGDIIEQIKESEDMASVYKKNIDACVKSKKRGGYSRLELIDIANRKLGLKVGNDMLKEEICKLVKDKLTQLKEQQSVAKIAVLNSVNSKAKRIKTVKLQRAKTFRDLEMNNESNT